MRIRHHIAVLLVVLAPMSAYSLEIGFEGRIGAEFSDNVNEANKGLEQDGTVAKGSFSIFGDQSSSRIRGSFLGEFNTYRQYDDDDTDTGFDTFTNFLGAVNVFITPRSFSWFVGDALGTVLSEGETQSLDETEGSRRNVFITGPSFSYELGSKRTFDSRLLYIHQSDDTVNDLASLVNFNAGYRSEYSGGNTLGFRVGNLFTDNPDTVVATDINRLTASVFWERVRGVLSTKLEIGGTQYDADGDSVGGALVRFDASRAISQNSGFTFSLVHDLADQTLNAIDSLVEGEAARNDDVEGVSQDTTISLGFNSATEGGNNFSWTIGMLNSDFKAINNNDGFSSANADLEDRRRLFASLALNRSLSAKIFGGLSASYIQEEFLNLPDESDSLLGLASLSIGLSRSWLFEVGVSIELAEGIESFSGTAQNDPATFDRVENAASLALRWEPPTKANKEMTVDLQSLLR